MKTFILLVIVYLINSPIEAQWFWQNPMPQGNDLSSVYHHLWFSVNLHSSNPTQRHQAPQGRHLYHPHYPHL